MMPDTSIGFFQCDSTTYSLFEEFDSTFSGETDDRTWSTLYDTSSGSSIISRPASASQIFEPNAPVASDPPSPPSGGATTSSPLPAVEQKKKAPIGAIVGGVVGGLAVLGGLIGATIFLLKRSKRQNSAANNADNFTSNQPPNQQGYDANQQHQQMQQQQYPQQAYPQSYGQQQAPQYFDAGKQPIVQESQLPQYSYVAGQQTYAPTPTNSPPPQHFQQPQQQQSNMHSVAELGGDQQYFHQQSGKTQLQPAQSPPTGPVSPISNTGTMMSGSVPTELPNNPQTGGLTNAEGRPVYEASSGR